MLNRTESSTDPWDTLLPAGLHLDLMLMIITLWNGPPDSLQCISLSVQHRGLAFVCRSVVMLHYSPSWDYFSFLNAFWLSNSPSLHVAKPWCHIQGQVGEMLLFTMCSVTGVALVCSTGSPSNVSCLCIWASRFQITPGLVLLVVDWVVSAWLLWNTHIFRSPWSRWKCSQWDTHACALSTEEISTSQVLLLLPPPVSFWGNLTDIYLGTIRTEHWQKIPRVM